MNRPMTFDRRFRLVAFDWDGTAVSSRADDATPIRGPVERLLRLGVLVVVITGTNLRNVDGQFSSAMRGRHKRNLFLATNRGSEVYGFDETYVPVRVSLRAATPEEDRALTAIADELRDRIVARTGLDIRIIYDRLNRRKVDLIPLEQWKDPPKSALGDLLVAVETRLKAAGLSGGISEVTDVARAIAQAKGLPEARITSDVKHVEVGLTDKADSVEWLLRELAVPKQIAPEEILIGGDEFGPIAGFPGSDSRMLVASAQAATFVSVGPEPAGVPAGVIGLGGGPARFRELLAAQAALHPVGLPAAREPDPTWNLVEEGFVLAREHEIESIFALSNGFVGSRGSLAEGSPLSATATFVAGVFETQPGPVPELARAPDWMHLSFLVDGQPLRLEAGEPLEHRRVLDLHGAILWRLWRQRDQDGRVTRVEGLRVVSLANRRLLLQSVALTPENYSGRITVESSFLTRAASVHATSGTSIELAAKSRIDDPEGSWARPPVEEQGSQMERWTVEAELGKTYRLDRLACVHTTPPSDGADGAAVRWVERAFDDGIETAVDEHRAAWRARWDASDVMLDGDVQVQRGLRFAAYHLIAAANPEDEHVSIGARALTGPAYKGHVFWDTEIFMLPFFTLTYPEAARALLMYRHHTLPAARARAARFGYRGALYAWESADTGEDVTPSFVLSPTGQVIRIFVGEQEQHISADVAYAVWSYWRATADDRFLLDAGAEIIVETARFWASRAQREADRRFHIRRVIGPDEYHEGVDDNAYTNGIARWNLEAAEEVISFLRDRWPDRLHDLERRLHLDADERRSWGRVARDLYFGVDSRTGVIEQFKGYFNLEEIELTDEMREAGPLDVLMGAERIRHSKIIKQADVLMLLYLLWDQYPAEVREANFRYYEARTSHGSSLSPPIHAALAARIGQTDLAARYLRQTVDIDLSNRMGNAAGGVHAAALGGLWQAVVFGFAGLALSDEGPKALPRFPDAWRRLRFNIQWRGRQYPFDLRRGAASAAAEEVRP